MAAAALMAAAISCSKAAFDADWLPETGPGEFRLSGAVYANSSGNAAGIEAVEGIRITVDSYAADDPEHVSPVDRDTVWTDDYGRWYVINQCIPGGSYVVEACDMDGEENGGRFSSKKLDIITDKKCQSMDNQIFFLEGLD